MPIAPTGTGDQVARLATRVDSLRSGQAYGIDNKGRLIGRALKSSFKGRIVDTLVSRGFAKAGTLSGRVAVALIGRKNFDLIHSAHNDPGRKSSIENVITLMKRVESTQARAQGLDSTLARTISKTVEANLRAGATLNDVSGERLVNLDRNLWSDVVPAQIALRKEQEQAKCIEIRVRIASGEPTKSMERADLVALEGAARSIREGQVKPEEVQIAKTAGNATQTLERARAIVADYNLIATATPEGELRGATGLFLSALKTHYTERDVLEGTGTRIDGDVARPVKAVVDERSIEGGITPFRTAGHAQTMRETGEPPTPKHSVRIAGQRSEQEDYGGPARAAPGYQIESARRALAGEGGGTPDNEEIVRIGKTLGLIAGDDGVSAPLRREAAQVLADPQFANSFDSAFETVRTITEAGTDEPSVERTFAQHADITALRRVIAPEVDRARQIESNPAAHPQLRAEYEEAFGDEGEYELLTWAKQTARRGGAALEALDFLETIGAKHNG